MNVCMYEELLPARLIIKGLINGEPKYNYETYLLEIINSSIYFCKKAGGKTFLRPQKEGNGEADCYSGVVCPKSYNLEFKLFAGKSLSYALSQTRYQYYVNDGIMQIGPRSASSKSASNIHKVLRYCSEDNFRYNGVNDGNEEMYQKDIDNLVKTMKTKKNLLTFYPFTFSFDCNYSFNYAVSYIREALQKDFCQLFQFRQKLLPDYETYFCFVYSDFFVFMMFENNQFSVIDYVNISKSKTYIEILELEV